MNLNVKDDWKAYRELLYYPLADNTRLAYEKGWNCFVDYCIQKNCDPLAASPDDITEFLIKIATIPRPNSGKTLSVSTVSIYNSAINSKYIQLGINSPTQNPQVKNVLRGLRRSFGTSCRRVKALREHHILKILEQCDRLASQPKKKKICLRDAGIIAIGFAGALRRSEICNLRVEDIQLCAPDGQSITQSKNIQRMYLTIRKSKTDQYGAGQRIPVVNGNNLRPIYRLLEWLRVAEISQGYLFQTMRRGGTIRGKPMHHSDIPRLVKYYVKLIGLNPEEFAGHSLRSGFVTSATVHNARLDKIMEVTRHTNPSTVMKYIRDTNSFSEHAGEKFL